MEERDGRYAAYTARLVDSVLTTPGQLQPDERRAILARAAGTASAPSGAASAPAVSPALTRYVDTVARHAYQVTDADVAALQRAGNADDALFEITVAAAVGAAVGRLERGLAALRPKD